MRKLRSARSLAAQAVARRRDVLNEKRKHREFDTWLGSLRTNPPDVLIGSNFAEYGGVRHHIHAIVRHSSLRIELAPPDQLLRSIPPHEIRTGFRSRFLDFAPSNIKAVHSHVFPWFIEWCHHHKGKSLWVHTYHLPYFAEHARDRLESWQEEINRVLVEDARHADVRVSVAKWQQTFLSEAHDIDTIYVPNGVDVEMCDAADSKRFTNHFGLDHFVLWVGRNDPVKGPQTFVELAIRMPSLQFVMIGRGLSTESASRDWNLEAPRNLKMLGELSHQETLDALSACSALVVTSKREGLPTLVLEAMALCKPIVVPDEPGCIEAIDNGKYGLSFQPGDIEDLVEKTSSALGEDRCDAARARVLEEYDWRVVSKRLDAIYRG